MFTERQYKEITGILLLFISVVLMLSLSSYDINDISLLAEGSKAGNLIGPIGAYFSESLRWAFGYLSFITVIIFAISGWSFLKKGGVAGTVERIFSLSYLMITSSAMVSLLHKSAVPHYSGGYTGLFLAGLFSGLFGQLGAFIVILVLNIIGLVLCGIVSFSLIIDDLDKRDITIKNMIQLVKKLFVFDYKNTIPRNDIEDAVNMKGKKLPWIIKKKIIIGDCNFEMPGMEGLRLIEHTPIPEGFTDEFNANLPAPLLPIIKEIPVRPDGSWNYDDIDPDNDNDIAFSSSGDLQDDISFRNYTDDEFAIKTNRIKSAVIEHDIKPEMIVDDFDEDLPGKDADGFDGSGAINEDEEYNDDKTVSVKNNDRKLLLKKKDESGDEDNDGNEKPATYIPRVFDKISFSGKYNIPHDFLDSSSPIDAASWKTEARRNSDLLVKTLNDFGIESRVVNVHRGPVITLYEIQIAPGIKVNRIVGLSDDIAMALAAHKVRVVAPIPGKSAIGVEIPNTSREMVTIGDIIKSSEYQAQNMRLKVGLGKDILGNVVTLDLKKQPHLLIAGATGSGKSICLNSIICDIIYNYDPNYVRFILIDPKMVELQLYNGLPHLLTQVITESYMAPRALKWACAEMERRYRLLSEVNARDIEKYNERIKGYEDKYENLPYIVIVIDELADLMMIAAKEIEGFITRIAQKARAVGIHLILATQRPSVDIITGIIKANFPARIAFQVAQKIDSRTILDQNGAEALLGKGDMLYQSPVSSFPVRVQGAYITEEEIMKIVGHTRKYGRPKYVDIEDGVEDEDTDEYDESDDILFVEAIKIVEETKKASASYLQRRLSIGYNRAARIIELMEERGYVGPQQGSKPREVYI